MMTTQSKQQPLDFLKLLAHDLLAGLIGNRFGKKYRIGFHRRLSMGHYIEVYLFVKRQHNRDSAISPLMKGATGLYSADLHKMGWVIFRKMGFSPKWEKVACDLPIFNAIHPNHPQFGHFYGLHWEVFHRRLIAQSLCLPIVKYR